MFTTYATIRLSCLGIALCALGIAFAKYRYDRRNF
jgi:hypothetical protein